MGGTQEFRGTKGARVLLDYDRREVVFEHVTVEVLWPRRRQEFRVSFDGIGRNSLGHPSIIGRGAVFLPLEDRDREWELLLTTKGRVWLDPHLVDREELLRSLHQIWEDNQRTMSEKERATLKRLSSTSHPVAKIVGIVLLLLGIAGVIYYFAVILPNLEV